MISYLPETTTVIQDATQILTNVSSTIDDITNVANLPVVFGVSITIGLFCLSHVYTQFYKANCCHRLSRSICNTLMWTAATVIAVLSFTLYDLNM